MAGANALPVRPPLGAERERERKKNIYLHKLKTQAMTITVITHKDVRGKTLQYLKFVNTKGNEHLVNIGSKTATIISELLEKEHDQSNKQTKNEK